MESIDVKLSDKRKVVSIGIPSFNEECNISRLLQSIVELNNSIVRQGHLNTDSRRGDDIKSRNGDDVLSTRFKIAEVIISDDSSDKTCSIVEEIAAKNPCLNIRLLHHDTRRGVSAAWNEIFKEARGEIIVLYDADIVLDASSTLHLVESTRGNVGLCASNPIPLLQKMSIVSRASLFIAQWLQSVRKEGLSQYTVMGRGLSVSSKIAKRITIPENVIALDLYLQCKVLEQGFDVIYDESAIVYFKPPENVLDFSSQILRATNGHKQLKHLTRATRCSLDFKTGTTIAVESAKKNPIGAICLAFCYLLLPYFKAKLSGIDSVKWHIANSTKGISSSN
jgi:cellulose synthase/poly-beta-1,6-N-acetylglucosamine synthase-like glycosyltransferase